MLAVGPGRGSKKRNAFKTFQTQTKEQPAQNCQVSIGEIVGTKTGAEYAGSFHKENGLEETSFTVGDIQIIGEQIKC